MLAFHSLVAKPFYIPSTSMMPSLCWWGIGLVVEQISLWVVHGAPLRASTCCRAATGGCGRTRPEYGDIVIPGAPDPATRIYIKRVVALPGDTIEVRGGARSFLNGQPIKREVVPPVRLAVRTGPAVPQHAVVSLLSTNTGVKSADGRRFSFEAADVARNPAQTARPILRIDYRDQRARQFTGPTPCLTTACS